MAELNWARSHTYAGAIVRPRDVEHLQQVVADAAKVRALGTRHSFTAIADGETIVEVPALPATFEVADDRQSVTVAAGLRYADVAARLDAEGLALHNMGSLPHISVGGATATGTHGSGSTLGALSEAVRAIELIGPDGHLHTLRRGDPDWDGAVVAVGALGVVVRVTLDVEPAYRMRADPYAALPWERFAADVPGFFASGTSVSVFTDFGDRTSALVKTRVPQGADDVAVPDRLFDAVRTPEPDDDRHTVADGSVGPWHLRLPHFRVDRVPSVGEELQSEHFVPLHQAAAALEALRRIGARIRPHLWISELRTVAADDTWLGPTGGVHALAIAFTWRDHPDAVRALLPEVDTVIAAATGAPPRPHLGKLFAPDAAEVLRLAPFRELAARRDPERKFVNPFLAERLGL